MHSSAMQYPGPGANSEGQELVLWLAVSSTARARLACQLPRCPGVIDRPARALKYTPRVPRNIECFSVNVSVLLVIWIGASKQADKTSEVFVWISKDVGG